MHGYIQQYGITLLDCFRGILRAKNMTWLEEFDLDYYDKFSDPRNADHTIFCPKLVAFRGPLSLVSGARAEAFAHVPGDFFDVFKDIDVTDIVRLNDPATYDISQFARAGFRTHDLYFDDCTTPTADIVERFLDIVDRAPGKVAVHCLAGLGRTGTLIGLWMMTRHGFQADECIAYLRIMRPGSVIGPQQQ
jgi:cell division cycle 14